MDEDACKQSRPRVLQNPISGNFGPGGITLLVRCGGSPLQGHGNLAGAQQQLAKTRRHALPLFCRKCDPYS